MKLEAFHNKDKKKKVIIGFTIACIALIIGVFLYHSYAWFESENTFNSFNGNVTPVGDLYFSVYIDGNASETLPQIDTGYAFDHGACSNGANVTWDNTNWAPTVTNLTSTRTKCMLYFASASSVTLTKLHNLNNNITLTPSTAGNPDFSLGAPRAEPGDIFDWWITDENYYITYGNDVTYDNTTKQYTLVDYTVCKYSECSNNLANKYVVMPDDYQIGTETNTPVYQTSEKSDHTVLKIIDSNQAIFYKWDELNSVKEGTWSSQTSGVYIMPDDYGTSYYFRGDIDYNYVQFSSWQTDYYNGYNSTIKNYVGYTSLSACQAEATNCTKYASDGDEMYWRIVRINGDGSLRLIYDGVAPHGKTDYEQNRESGVLVPANIRSIGRVGYQDYSNNYDNAYVGYMYGTLGASDYASAHTNTNDSAIKRELDKWYQLQLDGAASAEIVDNVFCNDRSIASQETINYANNLNLSNAYTSNAFGTNKTIYGPMERNLKQRNQSSGNHARLTCPQKNDAFTVSDTVHGNGALTYPVGLITWDEVNLAGGIDKDYWEFFLTSGGDYWTMSPYANNEYLQVTEILTSGALIGAPPTNRAAIRPVVNIRTNHLYVGTGTAADPFRIDIFS